MLRFSLYKKDGKGLNSKCLTNGIASNYEELFWALHEWFLRQHQTYNRKNTELCISKS